MEERIDSQNKDEVAEKARASKIGKWFDENVEHKMWNIKFFAFIAVFISLLVGMALMFYGAYEAFHLMEAIIFGHPAKEIQLLTLGVVDMFLFGMVMMIFAFGTYNLFISEIDNVGRDIRNDKIRPNWVNIRDFGGLKTIFIKVVIMILIITFLEQVVKNMDLFKEDVYSLLIIPVGIVLIAFSLKLLHDGDAHEEHTEDK